MAAAQVKLLAEPWDCGMYQVGTFPNWDVWGEWNGKFRDDFRCRTPPSGSPILLSTVSLPLRC